MDTKNSHHSNHSLQDSSTGPGSKIIGVVALVLVVAIASFFGGITYQKGHQKTQSGNTFAQGSNGQAPSGGNFGDGPGGGQMSGGFGTVTAISSSSISIDSTRAGTTSTYSITGTTTVTNNGSTAAVSDIKTGDTVIVQTSSSSSTAATQIVVNPSFNGGPGNGSATQ